MGVNIYVADLVPCRFEALVAGNIFSAAQSLSAVLLFEEFNLANRKARCQPISRVPTRWCPPQTKTVKINVNAGVFTDGSTGWGFVARDHQKGSNSRACV